MYRAVLPSALCLAACLVVFSDAPPVRRAHAGDSRSTPKTIGRFDRKDPRFDQLIPKGAVIEVLAEGFKWTEGPVWVKDSTGGHVLFSDIPNNRVMKWSQKGGLSEFLKPSGYTGKAKFEGYEPGSNGLTLDPSGNLVLCQHGDRRIARLKNGKFETLADKYMGKRLNSPNDLVYKKNGDLYFTDPPYGLPKLVKDPAKELDFQGVYRLKPNGELTLLTKELSRPNGVAFSPDEKTLYVANSDPDKAIVVAYPVKTDGTLAAGKVIYDATAEVKAMKPGLPDGLKVDAKGNVFTTGPDGLSVFAPDGTNLGKIVIGDRNANCAFGDDGSTLYICANDKFVRVKTTTKGQGF